MKRFDIWAATIRNIAGLSNRPNVVSLWFLQNHFLYLLRKSTSTGLSQAKSDESSTDLWEGEAMFLQICYNNDESIQFFHVSFSMLAYISSL